MDEQVHIVMPGTVDHQLVGEGGKPCFVGEVIRLKGNRRLVLATVYGDTVEEMRARKHAIWKALQVLYKVGQHGEGQ